MRATIILIVVLVLNQLSVGAQNYINYHKQLNEARLISVKGKHQAAAELFELTFDEFEFRFARDCVHAIQIASKTTDTTLLQFFVEAGIKQGIPLNYLSQMPELTWFRATANWSLVVQSADSLHNIYQSNINLSLREEVNQMFAEDQAIRNHYNKWYNFLAKPFIACKWRKLNAKQVERLVDITREYGFVGEQLIGIDLSTHHPAIEAGQLSAGMPIVILVHHYSKPNTSIDELLFEQLKLGYIDVTHFATICDFEAEFGRKKFEKRGYYGLRFGQRGRKINFYDTKRRNIGLPTLEDYKSLNNSTLLTKYWFLLK